jgi:hypothetical protein
MSKLYWTLGILAALLIGDLTRAHFDKRVHSEIYFSLFDWTGSERKLRQDILNKRIKRNLESARELHSNAK